MPSEETQFKPGTGGRPPGVQNKLTRTVKEAVLEAFNKLQADETHNLDAFAKKYPRDFYNIAAKLIPTEIQAKVQAASFELNITPMPGCEPIKPLTDGEMAGNTGD